MVVKPLGRPPAGFYWNDTASNFVHVQTGEVFNRCVHNLVKQCKKAQLCNEYYWKRNGRERRVERYRKTKLQQMKPQQVQQDLFGGLTTQKARKSYTKNACFETNYDAPHQTLNVCLLNIGCANNLGTISMKV